MAILKSAYIGGIGPQALGGHGPGLVRRFLAEGWQVFAGYHPEAARDIKGAVSAGKDACTAFSIDHADTGAIRSAAAEIANTVSALDLFVYCCDAPYPEPLEDEGLWQYAATCYDHIALGALRSVETFLPLLDAGSLKRLCWLSPGNASIQSGLKGGGFGQNMAAAAVHNAGAILFNRLRPEGYTFRVLFDVPGCPAVSDAAYGYFLRDRSFEAGNRLHSDEDRFTAKDTLGREHPW
ncbi:MAG: hypothetical protein JXB03_01305 [Spirochaetales bacterium]|nr:hypothetical protein [Spirochaetales bacterium]